MSDAYIVGLFTLAGTALGSLFTLIISNRNARIEERKHFRDLGMQIALLKFQKEQEMAQKLADLTGTIRTVPPFSAFVVDGIKMMEIIEDRSLNSTEVGRRLSELNKFTESVISEIRAQK